MLRTPPNFTKNVKDDGKVERNEREKEILKTGAQNSRKVLQSPVIVETTASRAIVLSEVENQRKGACATLSAGKQDGNGSENSPEPLITEACISEIATPANVAKQVPEQVERSFPKCSPRMEQIARMRAVEEDSLMKCVAVLRKMELALGRQKNVSKDIKEGVGELNEQMDVIASCRRIWKELELIRNQESERTSQKLKENKLRDESETPATGRAKRAASSPVAPDALKKVRENGEEGWQRVTSHKKKQREEIAENQTPVIVPQNIKKQKLAKEKEKRKENRKRPEAVLIKPAEGKSYAEVLKELKSAVKPEDSEISIRTVRKTKNGSILLELAEGGRKDRFCEAIKTSLKETVIVSTLKPKTTIEIRDMDALSEAEDVSAAIRELIKKPHEEMSVHVTGTNTREQRRAFVTLSTEVADMALNIQRIKIGWTYCRMRKVNLNRSVTADAMLEQIMIERSAGICIISEQYGPKSGAWYEDNSKTAALWLKNGANLHIIADGKGDGFVWVNTKMFTVMSCYLTPNCSIEDFKSKLGNIEDAARSIGGQIILAGDFNAKAIEWGMPNTNTRGREILNMMARLGLIVVNTGSTPTFRRAGCVGTIPDITLITEETFSRIGEWKVLEDYTASDHQCISFCIRDGMSGNENYVRKGTRKWNVAKLKKEVFLTRIDEATIDANMVDDVESFIKDTMVHISQACDASMPRIAAGYRRKAAYWWTEEISQLRRICHRCRRQVTRNRGTDSIVQLREDLRRARKKLKVAILQSKKNKWEELRAQLNNDPWGLGYKLVMKKLGSKTQVPILSRERMQSIIRELFPSHELREQEVTVVSDQAPLFTLDELKVAVGGMKKGKAPGPDGVPVEVLAIIAMERPQVLLHMYNACLFNGIFPEVWKMQKLVLISKGKGDPELASSYRPLCLLDTAGKVLERLIKPRLSRAIEEAGGLSCRQYGFRKGRSTIGALAEVVERAQYSQRQGNIVLLVTLDVKNAFNSARWCDILDALERRFQVPSYLARMIRSYLHNRKLLYDTMSGTSCEQITAGAAQGSILGPELWNAMYDEILCIDMPTDAYLVGYADDIAGVITARDTEDARRKLNQLMLRTQSWMVSRGLRLAIQKTELVFLTRKHIPVEIQLPTSFESFVTKKAINYLGIRLDSKLHFWEQIHQATAKAARTTAMLSKLMANTGGPTAVKRKLLMATTNAILLYGCEVWGDAIKAKHRRKALGSVQRTAALRVASAYRTVSEAAVMVISGTIPIDFLVSERKMKWQLRERTDVPALNLRQQTIDAWQSRWQEERFGRWTARLIPNICPWVKRTFGEINYYLTQLLSGHGYFRKYLYRMGKTDSPNCIYGDADVDDVEHTFFNCIKWRELRTEVERQCGSLTPENIVRQMLLDESNWNTIARYTESVLRTKKRDLG